MSRTMDTLNLLLENLQSGTVLLQHVFRRSGIESGFMFPEKLDLSGLYLSFLMKNLMKDSNN